MKQIKFLSLGLLIIILVSCQESLKEIQDLVAQEQIQVIDQEITPYEFSGGKTVTRVKSKLTNISGALEFYYTLTIRANGTTHVDSIPLYMELGDTVKTEIIFTELLYKSDLTLEASHKIYPIRNEEVSAENQIIETPST
jgi:hypothetical protein